MSFAYSSRLLKLLAILPKFLPSRQKLFKIKILTGIFYLDILIRKLMTRKFNFI